MTAEERAATLCEYHRRHGFSGECGYCAEAVLALRAHAHAALDAACKAIRKLSGCPSAYEDAVRALKETE